jgi:hypothetical protein
MTLRELQTTTWAGRSELWLDPLGDQAIVSECTITLGDRAIDYAWTYEGKPQAGRLALRDGGADFTDTWHSPSVMPCEAVAGSWALVDVEGTYAAGGGPPWGWRILVCHRPSDELVLQMTNIAPWGERGRAVRMITRRA